MVTPSVAICPHLSIEHFRGGEKWAVSIANRLSNDVHVAVKALPYAPGGVRRVEAPEVLDSQITYTEAWRHDLGAFDAAYIFYHPFAQLSFHGATRSIAGIHSWVYVSDRIYESHYGPIPTVVKVLYRGLGRYDLNRYEAVHAVTPAFDSPHPNTAYIPNFVDTELFSPDRASLSSEFMVLVTAAHIREKGWDAVVDLATDLPTEISLAATGTSGVPGIRDLGFLTEEELADAYARAHVVLHPARVDTDSMVINEACASGTPVVTTPLPTHTVRNEAVLHCSTVEEMFATICMLYREWRSDDGYANRCRKARTEGMKHDFDVIFPRLKRLILPEVAT